jgi:hypothetical protein
MPKRISGSSTRQLPGSTARWEPVGKDTLRLTGRTVDAAKAASRFGGLAGKAARAIPIAGSAYALLDMMYGGDMPSQEDEMQQIASLRQTSPAKYMGEDMQPEAPAPAPALSLSNMLSPQPAAPNSRLQAIIEGVAADVAKEEAQRTLEAMREQEENRRSTDMERRVDEREMEREDVRREIQQHGYPVNNIQELMQRLRR